MRQHRIFYAIFSVLLAIAYIYSELIYQREMSLSLVTQHVSDASLHRLEIFGRSIGAFGLALFLSRFFVARNASMIARAFFFIYFAFVAWLAVVFISENVVQIIPSQYRAGIVAKSFLIGGYRHGVLAGTLHDDMILTPGSPPSLTQRIYSTHVAIANADPDALKYMSAGPEVWIARKKAQIMEGVEQASREHAKLNAKIEKMCAAVGKRRCQNFKIQYAHDWVDNIERVRDSVEKTESGVQIMLMKYGRYSESLSQVVLKENVSAGMPAMRAIEIPFFISETEFKRWYRERAEHMINRYMSSIVPEVPLEQQVDRIFGKPAKSTSEILTAAVLVPALVMTLSVWSIFLNLGLSIYGLINLAFSKFSDVSLYIMRLSVVGCVIATAVVMAPASPLPKKAQAWEHSIPGVWDLAIHWQGKILPVADRITPAFVDKYFFEK
jgi:hypothetical protein